MTRLLPLLLLAGCLMPPPSVRHHPDPPDVVAPVSKVPIRLRGDSMLVAGPGVRAYVDAVQVYLERHLPNSAIPRTRVIVYHRSACWPLRGGRLALGAVGAEGHQDHLRIGWTPRVGAPGLAVGRLRQAHLHEDTITRLQPVTDMATNAGRTALKETEGR